MDNRLRLPLITSMDNTEALNQDSKFESWVYCRAGDSSERAVMPQAIKVEDISACVANGSHTSESSSEVKAHRTAAHACPTLNAQPHTV